MKYDGPRAGAAEADDLLQTAAGRRVAAVGMALIRAKHDLNNLFHVARGWSRLLKDPRSGISQTQEGIDAVLSAAEQTSELVDGILALNGRATDGNALCNLAQELALLARGLCYLLPVPDRLRHELAAPVLVLCDFAAVRSALIDAVLGVRDTLGDADLWLRLREVDASEAEASKPEVELTLARVEKGTASDSPVPTSLCLRFPSDRAAPSNRASAAAERRPRPLSTTTPSSTAVLLVDDHRDVRRLATTMLERAGYQVLTASDAEEALVTSQNYDGPIHVLCCDAQMPGLPALRLITELCAARPLLKVLVCTGERPQGKLAEFPRLSKPFSYQQLVSAVRGCLE